jgi:hypothetical protein
VLEPLLLELVLLPLLDVLDPLELVLLPLELVLDPLELELPLELEPLLLELPLLLDPLLELVDVGVGSASGAGLRATSKISPHFGHFTNSMSFPPPPPLSSHPAKKEIDIIAPINIAIQYLVCTSLCSLFVS